MTDRLRTAALRHAVEAHSFHSKAELWKLPIRALVLGGDKDGRGKEIETFAWLYWQGGAGAMPHTLPSACP